MTTLRDKYYGAFTLIELLVVIAIIGVLASIGLTSFGTAQMRSRDAERKSDLKQISSSLEIFYSDYGRYPSDSSGYIQGCPSTTGISCVWGATDGTGEFTDNKTTYFMILPKDPSSGKYFFRIVPSSDNQKFQLYAHLENSQDTNCLPNASGNKDCVSPKLPTTAPVPSCGSGICNFAITSSNTTPTE